MPLNLITRIYRADHHTVVLPHVKELVLYRSLRGEEEHEWYEFGTKIHGRCPYVGVVDTDSPKAMRTAATALAIYFKREFGYDFVQFSESSDDCDPEDKCFLFDDSDRYMGTIWAEKGTVITGAVSFRKVDRERVQLQWAWFHPYHRRRGLLSKAWPIFQARYGKNFPVEGPLSDAMQSFLEKHGHRVV